MTQAIQANNHLCGMYRDHPREQASLIMPFIRDGLNAGERCVYVIDDQPWAELRDALAEYGVDADQAVCSGQLQVWTRQEWRPAALQSEDKAAELRSTIDGAIRAGFNGVRFVVEMTWARTPDIAADALAHWEATIDTVITPDVPARMICIYNRSLLDPAVIRAGLTTHQVALIGEEAIPNPFYEAPLILDGVASNTDSDGARRQCEWMIDRLLSLRSQAATIEPVKPAAQIRQDFANLVSHEIRNPLTTVVGFTTFLEQRWPDLDEDVISETLRLISRDAGRLSEFVENLIVLSGTGVEMETEPVSVPVIAKGVIEGFRRTRPAREIALEISAGIPPARGNSGMIAQAIRNLLSNADRYSDAGSPVAVTIDASGGFVDVRIQDEGEGPPEGVDDPAFQPPIIPPDGQAQSSGVGLGLTTCRRLAAAMGGILSIEPRLDARGTVAVLSIPECTA